MLRARVPGFRTPQRLPHTLPEYTRFGPILPVGTVNVFDVRHPDDETILQRVVEDEAEKHINAIGRMSETDDAQKAMNACNIGTQPVRPAVYGVNAPL